MQLTPEIEITAILQTYHRHITSTLQLYCNHITAISKPYYNHITANHGVIPWQKHIKTHKRAIAYGCGTFASFDIFRNSCWTLGNIDATA